MIEVVHGDALAWILDHDPREFAVLTIDPPYGIEAHNGSIPRGKFEGVRIAGDTNTEARDTVLRWWGTGPAAVFGNREVDHFGVPRGVLTWDKIGVGMGDLGFPWTPDNTEEVAVYGAGWEGKRSTSVLHFHSMGAGRTHPHEKPVALWMSILAKAPPGRVLDTFGGTGSTAEAAHRMGRDCTIIEIDPRWWPELDARVERLHSQMRLFA